MSRIFVVSLLCLAACSVPEEKKSRSARRTAIGDACTSAQTGTQNCDASGDVIVCSGTQWILDTTCPSATPCTMLAGGVADCSGGTGGTCSAAEASDEMCSNSTTIVMCNGTDWVFSRSCTGGTVCEDGGGFADCVSGGGGTCTAGQTGDEMCSSSTTIVACNGTDWVFSQNCTGGTTCQDGGGVATCEGGTTSCTNFSAGTTDTYYDPTIIGYAELFTLNTAQDHGLDLQNLPGFNGGVMPGSTTTVPISGNQLSYETCGVCMYVTDGTTYYWAESGSATITMPSNTGGTMSVSLSNVRFREMDSNGVVMPSGRCVNGPTTTLSAPAGRWPCADSFPPGSHMCQTDGETIFHILGCDTQGYVFLEQDCADTGETCVDGGTACQ
jgi:hypothetical protein